MLPVLPYPLRRSNYPSFAPNAPDAPDAYFAHCYAMQTGRNSHAACLSSVQSIQRSIHLAAKQGGLAAAAVGAAADWRVVLSSAAAVVCLAMWLKTRNE